MVEKKEISLKVGALVLVALLVAGLCVPAYAQPPALNLDDFYDTSFVEGNVRTARYIFDIPPVTRLEPYPWTSSADVSSYTGNFSYSFHTPDTGYNGNFNSRTFLLGEVGFAGQGMPANGTIDITNIMPGATVSVELYYNLVLTKHFGEARLDITTRSGYMMYDKSGGFLATVWGSSQNMSLSDVGDAMLFHKVDLLEVADRAAYILPFINVSARYNGVYSPGDSIGVLLFDFQQFYIDVPVNMLYEILQQPEKEKDELQDAADNAIDGITGALPDLPSDVGSAFGALASALSYNGTSAKLTIPAAKIPGISGLFGGFTLMDRSEVDFSSYIGMMPGGLLLLVQNLLTVALIIFCFKEIYDTISYVLTLRKGD